jgi:protein-disulfide isomerase
MLAACNNGTVADPSGNTPAEPTTTTTTTTTSTTDDGLDPNVYKMPIDGFPAIGPANALVTIVFFQDYQCPFCRRLERELDQLRADHPDDVRVVYAPHPLPMHARAEPAARAALAAAAQGKFAEMHRRLIDSSNLEDESLTASARALGLDVQRFDEDRAASRETIGRADDVAMKFSVKGTPSVFINGRRIAGAQRELVRRIAEDQLANARSLVSSGTDRKRIYEKVIERGLDTAGPDPSLKLLPRFRPAQ